MKTYQANLLNSLTLIIVGLLGVFANNPDLLPDLKLVEKTPFIPVFFGVILLLSNKALKHKNKIIAHIVVLLTFMILVALIYLTMPNQVNDKDIDGAYRVLAMINTSFLAMITFIMSFISNRKKS